MIWTLLCDGKPIAVFLHQAEAVDIWWDMMTSDKDSQGNTRQPSRYNLIRQRPPRLLTEMLNVYGAN